MGLKWVTEPTVGQPHGGLLFVGLVQWMRYLQRWKSRGRKTLVRVTDTHRISILGI